ncbi:MAG: prenyltransferase [Chloroflexi bacterium]|nr:prenyltransferase [Chloroflexota bacterium]
MLWQKTYLKALFGLGRPIILLGVLMVHSAGAAMAYARGYTPDAAALVWGFVALFFAGASVNYANEYADFETDALTEKTRYSGGSGILPGGSVPRALALQAAWVSLLLGLGIAALGAALGILNPAALSVLALGAVGGWMYSLPPLKLAWNGAAEAANAALGGLLLPLYGYTLLARRVDWDVIAVFLPYALLIFTTAMATTYPDRAADRQVGKRTLATWMPEVSLRRIYVLVSATSFALLPLLVWWRIMPPQVALVSFVPLPAVVIAARQYTCIRNPHPTARASMMMIFAQTAGFLWMGAVL